MIKGHRKVTVGVDAIADQVSATRLTSTDVAGEVATVFARSSWRIVHLLDAGQCSWQDTRNGPWTVDTTPACL